MRVRRAGHNYYYLPKVGHSNEVAVRCDAMEMVIQGDIHGGRQMNKTKSSSWEIGSCLLNFINQKVEEI